MAAKGGMDNSQRHINQMGVTNAQYIDPIFPYHGMPGYPTPQPGAGHATTTSQFEGKNQLSPQDMLPYTFQGTERELNERDAQQQQVAERQAYATPQSAVTPGGRDVDLRNAAPPMPQRMNHDLPDDELRHDAHTQSRHENPEDARAMRSGSQIAEARYEEFGMNNPSAMDGSDFGKGQRGGDEKVGTPAWTELKTKAGKERKRLPLACIACRRKKIRCSGEKPACKHCLRSRIPCVYKVTTRKAAPRTDYMAMLDKRLKRMEERIIKIIPKEEQDLTTVVRAQVKPALPGTTPTKPATKKRPAEEAFSSELEAWAQSTRLSNQGLLPTSLKAQENEENKILLEGVDALPPKDIQEHLAEVFFDNLYGQAYHVLHKPSYMARLKEDTLAPVLNLAVCAVAARFSTHPKINSHPAFLRGESWAAEARKIVLNRYEWPNITILTCLLLLGLHEFGTCYGGRSWAFGGMAIRMAYALQLHRDLDFDPCKPNSRVELSFVDREIRRRTMWACFLMDRFNSSGTDRPMFIKEETIRIQLPIREYLFQRCIPGQTEDLEGNVPYPSEDGVDGELINARDNMGVAAYMIKSIALWGRIIIYHFQGGRERDSYQIWETQSEFSKLQQESEKFVAMLPESLEFSQQNLDAHQNENIANQFLFLHISGQQNILLLNHNATQPMASRLFRSPIRSESPRDFLKKCTKSAFEAANKVSEVLLAAEEFPLTAPFAGYCAFLSSSVQITAAFGKDEAVSGAAKRNLATNVRFLAKAKRYWGAFHWTSEQLKKQFKTCAEGVKRAQQGQGPEPARGAAMTMYGDWFDRYPHGVSQSDYEDPAANIKQEKGDDAVLGYDKSNLQDVEQFCRTAPQTGLLDGKATAKKRKVGLATKPGNGQVGGPGQAEPSLAGQPIATPSPSYIHEELQHQPQQGQHTPLGHPHNPLQLSDPHGLMPRHPTSVTQGYSSHLAHNFITATPQTQHSLARHSQRSPHPQRQHQQQPHHSQQPASQPYYPTASDFSFSTNQMGLGLNIMPQLDRQLVYGAYNSGLEMRGVDINAAIHGDAMTWNAAPHQGHNPHHPASGAGQAAEHQWQASEQPTSAWFMPFNMEPPPDVGNEGDGFGLGLGGEQSGGYGMEMGMSLDMNMRGIGPHGGGNGGPADNSMGGSNHGT